MKGWRSVSLELKKEVQKDLSCCGYDDKVHNSSDPMGHPECDLVSIVWAYNNTTRSLTVVESLINQRQWNVKYQCPTINSSLRTVRSHQTIFIHILYIRTWESLVSEGSSCSWFGYPSLPVCWYTHKSYPFPAIKVFDLLPESVVNLDSEALGQSYQDSLLSAPLLLTWWTLYHHRFTQNCK